MLWKKKAIKQNRFVPACKGTFIGKGYFSISLQTEEKSIVCNKIEKAALERKKNFSSDAAFGMVDYNFSGVNTPISFPVPLSGI